MMKRDTFRGKFDEIFFSDTSASCVIVRGYIRRSEFFYILRHIKTLFIIIIVVIFIIIISRSNYVHEKCDTWLTQIARANDAKNYCQKLKTKSRLSFFLVFTA